MIRFLAIFSALILTTALAAAQPLAPGKPAGIAQAQHISYRQGFIGLSIVAVALVYALPASSTTSTTATSTATTS